MGKKDKKWSEWTQPFWGFFETKEEAEKDIKSIKKVVPYKSGGKAVYQWRPFQKTKGRFNVGKWFVQERELKLKFWK